MPVPNADDRVVRRKRIVAIDREGVRLARETFTADVTDDRLIQIRDRLQQLEAERWAA